MAGRKVLKIVFHRKLASEPTNVTGFTNVDWMIEPTPFTDRVLPTDSTTSFKHPPLE
jgi:hypothetical protein